MIQNVDYYNKVKKEPNIKCFHDILTFLLYFLHQDKREQKYAKKTQNYFVAY